MPRCVYIYDDATRCVFDDARLAEGQMCGAHKVIVGHDARKATKRARETAKATRQRRRRGGRREA